MQVVHLSHAGPLQYAGRDRRAAPALAVHHHGRARRKLGNPFRQVPQGNVHGAGNVARLPLRSPAHVEDGRSRLCAIRALAEPDPVHAARPAARGFPGRDGLDAEYAGDPQPYRVDEDDADDPQSVSAQERP